MIEWSKKLHEWNQVCTGLAGRRKTGWGNDVRSMKTNDWTKRMQERVKWKVEKAKTFRQ